MGLTKTEEFTVKDNRIARYAKALGHPARIAILQRLLKNPGCMCGDIVEGMPLSQSTISQHLKALKGAGLIKGSISGTCVCYCINEEEWKSAQKYFNGFFNTYVKGQACC